MAYLVLVRHGQSEWNAKGLWTGKTDIDLTEKGREEAKQAAEEIKDIPIDLAYTSGLKRAKETWAIMQHVLHRETVPTVASDTLDERDYGNFDGMHKNDVEKEYGEELFEKWHRGWDYPLPHGETLKQVFDRAVPYYLDTILPELKSGKNVIVAAHGNSLRALVKYLDNLSDTDITQLNIPTGGVYIYTIDNAGSITHKEVRGSQN